MARVEVVNQNVGRQPLLRRAYYGHAMRHDGDMVDIGIFTDMTEIRRKSRVSEYIVVVDGKIIHFAPDAIVWLEL